jgi:glc operon protein GlcG
MLIPALLSGLLLAQAPSPPASFFTRADLLEAVRNLKEEDKATPGLFAAPLPVGGEYPVVGVRRTKVGTSEIHVDFTDVFYVLEGAATITTGGTLEGGKDTGPGEIRGSGVTGGASRKVGPGDFAVVTAGVPHWVSAIEGKELLYVVVKVPRKVP